MSCKQACPEAINSIFPRTEIQLCIIHQIRNSLKYIASKNQKEFMVDLKEVYQANSKDLAESKLLELEEKWGKKYPLVLKSWNNNWHNLSGYFKYPAEIRKMIYTTNAVEGLHRQIRKVTKTKGSFTIPKHKFILPSNFVFLVKIYSKNNTVSLDTVFILCRNFSSKILCWMGV